MTRGKLNRTNVLSLPGLRVFAHPRFRLAAAVLLFLAALYLAALGARALLLMTDYRDFVVFATHGWKGQQPYYSTDAGTNTLFLAGGGGAIYTPPFLFMMWPWTVLPQVAGAWLWLALEFLCLGAAIGLVYDSIGRPTMTEALVVISVILVLPPLRDNFADGQVGLLLALALSFAMWAHLRGRGVMAGAGVAVAAAIKLTPFAVLAFFAFRRDWRAVAAACGTLAAIVGLTLAVGWGRHWPQFVHNLGLVATGTGHPLNQSLNGLVLRTEVPTPLGEPIPVQPLQVRLEWWGLQLVLGVALVLGVVRRPAGDVLSAWALFCAVLLALPALSPFAWPHHYAQALPAVPVAARLVRERRLRWVAMATALVALVAVLWLEVPFYFGALAYGPAIGAHPWPSLGASILLFAVLAWIGVLLSAKSTPAGVVPDA